MEPQSLFTDVALRMAHQLARTVKSHSFGVSSLSGSCALTGLENTVQVCQTRPELVFSVTDGGGARSRPADPILTGVTGRGREKINPAPRAEP